MDRGSKKQQRNPISLQDSLSNSEKERQPIEELKTIPSGSEVWISSFSTTVILTGKFVAVDETELIIEQDEKQISVPLADIKRVRMEQSSSSSGVNQVILIVSAVGLLALGIYGAVYGALKGIK